MSGYNSRTGRFELTRTKADYYWRRAEPCPESMEGFAEVLRKSGIEVFRVHNTWLECGATQGQIWTSLSGQPSRQAAARW